jgi:hypothetical protein
MGRSFEESTKASRSLVSVNNGGRLIEFKRKGAGLIVGRYAIKDSVAPGVFDRLRWAVHSVPPIDEPDARLSSCVRFYLSTQSQTGTRSAPDTNQDNMGTVGSNLSERTIE